MPIIQPNHREIEEAAYYCWKNGRARHTHAMKDWLQAQQLVFMAKNYIVLGHHLLQGDAKEKLWQAERRICRYCGAVKPSDRGWKEAHALPELVGNKTIIATDECTTCNEHFAARMEDDFGKLLQLSRSVTQVSGKEGVPSFKTRAGKSRIDFDGHKFEIKQYEDDPFTKLDRETNALTMAAESQRLVPLAAYKCLTKMAIAIMPPPRKCWMSGSSSAFSEYPRPNSAVNSRDSVATISSP